MIIKLVRIAHEQIKGKVMMGAISSIQSNMINKLPLKPSGDNDWYACVDALSLIQHNSISFLHSLSFAVVAVVFISCFMFKA